MERWEGKRCTEGKHNGVVEREVYRLKGSTMERWEGQCTEGKHNGAVGSVVKGGEALSALVFLEPLDAMYVFIAKVDLCILWTVLRQCRDLTQPRWLISLPALLEQSIKNIASKCQRTCF